MWSLIRKDLSLQVKSQAFYLGVISLGLLLLMGVDRIDFFFGFSVALTFISAYTYTLRSTLQEEKDKTLLLLRALPIKPYLIVISKYLGGILVSVVAILYLTGFHYVWLVKYNYDVGEVFGSLYIFIGGLMMIHNSLYLGLFFRWGYKAASNTLGYGSLLFWIPLFVSQDVFENFLGNLNKESLKAFIEGPEFFAFVMAIALMVTVISLLFSLYNFSRKEL